MSSNQQFSLRWNNYVQHITHVFTSLRDEENLVDVTLCCEGKKIRAHKMLLSACSTYFREIFKENPCQHPVIIFRNVKYKDLEALISFMYKGEVNVEQEGLSSFLSTAELLEVKGLTGSGPCIPETVVDEDVSSSETKQTSKQSSSSPKCNKPDSPVSKKRKTVAVEEFSPPSTPKIKSEPEFTETDYYDNPGSPEIVKSEPMDSAWNNDENTETGNEGTAGTSNDGLQDTLQVLDNTMAPGKKLSREESLRRKREAERLRYNKMKNDPILLEQMRMKERQKYQKKREKNTIKLASEMSPRERRIQRKNWRKWSKTRLEKQRRTHCFDNFLELNCPPSTPLSRAIEAALEPDDVIQPIKYR